MGKPPITHTARPTDCLELVDGDPVVVGLYMYWDNFHLSLDDFVGAREEWGKGWCVGIGVKKNRLLRM